MPAHAFEYVALLSIVLVFLARLATGRQPKARPIAHTAFVLGFFGLLVAFGRWLYTAIAWPGLGRGWYVHMPWYEWLLMAFEWLAMAMAIALCDLILFAFAVALIEYLARGCERIIGWNTRPETADQT